MQCCVPFCRNTPDNVPAAAENASYRITFHAFPSEVHLRTAWLRALGRQDTPLPDSAVVCSQHFLNDNMYETENGLRQIHTGAVPSTVQICMICLDMASKLVLISTHKLEDAYKKLTGYPLYEQGNLKPTLCVQCAQRLKNFRSFRNKSLRTRSLMMGLVEKHKLITVQHLQAIDLPKDLLHSHFVSTTLGPNHYDLHIVDNSDDAEQMMPPTQVEMLIVKKEDRCDATSPIENMEVLYDSCTDHVNDEFIPSPEKYAEENIMVEIKPLVDPLRKALQRNPTESSSLIGGYMTTAQDPLKYECATYKCTVCFEEFVGEHKCNGHDLTIHLQQIAGDGEESPVCGPRLEAGSKQSSSRASCKTRRTLKRTNKWRGPPVPTRLATNNPIEVSITEKDNTMKKNNQGRLDNRSSDKTYIQKSLQNDTDRSHSNINIKLDTTEKQYSCKLCKYECAQSRLLTIHMRTHSAEKPYTCEVCKYKCTQNSDLTIHMRKHTGEKPYSCDLCDYKCARHFNLVRHVKNHTGDKPYSCEVCDYKCVRNSDLVTHLRTHTGEKPYSCDLCLFKCAHYYSLVRHMKNHTGEKPYSCDLCEHRCAQNSDLMRHMKTHTGVKRYSCKLCECKCARRSHLVSHMKIHSVQI